MPPILLDTCAVLWSVSEGGLSDEARAAIESTEDGGPGILVSPISAWEIGMLVARGRIALPVSPDEWFATFLAQGVELAAMTPKILVDSSFLPGSQLRDPADRIIAATARSQGYRLMTRDGPLLAYGAAGHMQVIPC